jgi:DNA-binding NarL/FixJ family response regulator
LWNTNLVAPFHSGVYDKICAIGKSEMLHVVSVLLIENQPLTRLGVRTVIDGESDIQLAAEADNATDGFKLFRELKPDVTILGLRLPDSCAIDDLDNYFIADPKAKIIVLAEHAGDAEITKALRKGAAGYICKGCLAR